MKYCIQTEHKTVCISTDQLILIGVLSTIHHHHSTIQFPPFEKSDMTIQNIFRLSCRFIAFLINDRCEHRTTMHMLSVDVSVQEQKVTLSTLHTMIWGYVYIINEL